MHGKGGLALALISAGAFGGSGVAAKPLIAAGLDPLDVVWIRVSGAALVLLPVALRHRSALRRWPWLLVGFSLFAVVGVQTSYFAALSRIPVGVALLVEYLGPVLVLGWVRLVQRKPVSRAAAVGVLLAVGGLACVVEVWSGLAFATVGLLLAFAAAWCQAAYFILADHGSGDDDEAIDPLVMSSYGLLIGALVLTVIARPWDMAGHVLREQVAMGSRDVPAVLLVGWMVLVSTVLAYLTGVVAVRRLSPQVAGVVAFLEAVIATVFAWVLLGEHLSVPQLLGGFVVLAGAGIAQTAARGRAAEERSPQRPVRSSDHRTGEPGGHRSDEVSPGSYEPTGRPVGP